MLILAHADAFGVNFDQLGRRTTVIYLVTVAISAFGGGLLLDWFMTWAQTAMPVLTKQVHEHVQLGWFDHLSAVVLVLIMMRAWFLARRRGCGCDDGDDGGCCSVPAG